MLRKILSFGVAAGLIVGIPMSTMVVTGSETPGPSAMAVGYLMMLIALSLVFVAIKRHRDLDRGGVIRFLPAFGLGIGISIVAGIVYVIAWESAVAISHLDFPTAYYNALIEQKRAAGGSPAELAALAAEKEQFRIQYANPLFRLPMVFLEIFPVGLLVSLVSAAVLRNPRILAARRAGEPRPA